MFRSEKDIPQVNRPDSIAVPQSLDAVAAVYAPRRSDYQIPVRVLTLVTALIPTLVLIGWSFAIEPLKRIAPGLTSMNPMTATSLAMSCLALWLIKEKRPAGMRGLIADLLAVAVVYVGAAKLIDLVAGTSFCPDALLFRSQLDYGQAYPSRIAPNVALGFVILGVSLLAIDRPRWPQYLHPQWLVAPILVIAFTAVMGYAYEATGFYKFKEYIPMALHTAIGFILISTAIVLSRPDQGYLSLIPKGSPGAHSYARLLPACVLIPALLGRLALYGADHDWFVGTTIGASWAAVLTTLTLAVMIFFNSVELNRAEAIRRCAEARLHDLVGALQREIDERKRMEEIAAYQATHDSLTGLPNRLLFVDHLEKAIARAVRGGDPFALLYIDVDRFKPVNDYHGHLAGDELLKKLAQRLRSNIREVDTAARLGGDEFAAILEAPLDTGEARRLAERVCAAMSKPYEIALPSQKQQIQVTVGASVGIALFPGHAQDLDSLVRLADHAMYRAKVDGKANGRPTNIEFAA